MNFKDYEAKRKKLMDKAEAFINDGKPDEAEAIAEEITALDEKWDAICKAKANLDALNGDARKQNISNPGATLEEGAVENNGSNKKVKPEEMYMTDEYRNAWAKKMMNVSLTPEEAETFKMANEYVHTTDDAGVLVPETVAEGIWSEVEDLYPYFADVTKTYVPGTFKINKSDTSSDAGWYEEDTETEDGKETFVQYTLNGCDLSRSVTISWRLKEMAVDDFISYLRRRMAEKMGAGLGYGVTNGVGNKKDDAAPEPYGVVTELKEDGTQVVKYTAGEMTYKNVTAARALIKAGYANGLKIYANGSTIWDVLANIEDANGRPIFVSDPTTGGVRVLGLTVEEDSSLADGDVLFSNAARGYHANINKQISISTEDHVKQRATDYVGYAIADGAALTLKAHALLTVGE